MNLTQLNAIVRRYLGDLKLDTHVIINEEGQIASIYRKVHLFDIDLTHKVILVRRTFIGRIDNN